MVSSIQKDKCYLVTAIKRGQSLQWANSIQTLKKVPQKGN